MSRPRSDWAFPECVRRVIVHHSASSRLSSPEQIRAEHIRVRHWKDVGYHFIVHHRGVSPGRPVWTMGSHDQGQNADSIGVILVGDWRLGKDGHPWEVAPSMWAQLVSLCADLLDSFDLPTTALEGHREKEPPTSPTACPGFDPDRLRDAVSAERKRRRMYAADLYPYSEQL